MSSDYVGCQVSVEVGGGLGWYQGRVVSINSERQTITITQVLHNGRPAALSEVTINAGDIIDLTILSRPKADNDDQQQQKVDSKPIQQQQQVVQPQAQQQSSQNPQSCAEHVCIHQQKESRCSPQPQAAATADVTSVGSTTNALQQPRRKPRTSVGETLAHGSHSSAARESAADWQRMNQTIVTAQEYSSPRRYDRYGIDVSRTPGKKERMRRNRDETTFGTLIDDDMLATEFDFEKNLALFDKQAVIEEIQSLKPDVVRQADRYTEKKYRCDENVLPSKPPVKRQIIVPTSGAAEVIYANDSGLLVPSVSSDLRAALLSTANQHGLTNSRQLEMIGRAATEIILSLSGGSHRLGTGNSHQPLVVVVLCGCHLQGAAGVNTARQLESHGVQTVVVTLQMPSSPQPPLLFTHELQLYTLTNGRTTSDPRGIPSTLDLIVDARLDHSGRACEGGVGHTWLNSTSAWASTSRAPILALDPPSDLAAIPSTQPPLPARVLLCPALPLAYTPARGKVYLINLPIPQQTFNAVGIKYVSPFGAKLVIPLHPCE
ncbi:enhancer of mRNA-decapping protein 3-like [Homarus americanus]|uniref:Enhancer of mRNA-decapping protein 3 n=1 Tax=Homarus americanus TaxID=6706 RepID=A0A8J5JGW0_HOMAM|nr:enhancer of mRNA-decapping protein 3-like [Homarus americanus]KAG7155943.1 Enhancer of mRNA-decapping protein 3-like [Homarus americanus]